MTSRRLTLGIVGGTGVGKSTLINHLLGMHVCETGRGRGITPQGFHRIECELSGVPFDVFDSGGVEVDSLDQWRTSAEHHLDAGLLDALVLCIDSTKSRIEEYEAEMVRMGLSSGHVPIVALTKADRTSAEQLLSLTKETDRAFAIRLPVVPTSCGVGTTTPVGRDELLLEILQAFWRSLMARLPEQCAEGLRDRVRAWSRAQKRWLRRNGLGEVDVLRSARKKMRDFGAGMAETVSDVVRAECEAATATFCNVTRGGAGVGDALPAIDCSVAIPRILPGRIWFLTSPRKTCRNAEMAIDELSSRLTKRIDQLRIELSSHLQGLKMPELRLESPKDVRVGYWTRRNKNIRLAQAKASDR